MKLRNKKTGKIWDIGKVLTNDYPSYDTLEQITEDFEDYNPPLIKDEKIRKAVRAWAEANDFTNEIEVSSLNAGTIFSEGHWSIGFIGYFIYDLKIGSTYTIAELCGEEKE